MPRVGAVTVKPAIKPPCQRIRPIRELRPGTPFVMPAWLGAPEDWAPTRGVLLDMVGDDAKVLVAERSVCWSGMTLVVPTGEPGDVPQAAQARPSGPSRAERRAQIAVAEHAVAVSRSAPRPVEVVQTAFGEEC